MTDQALDEGARWERLGQLLIERRVALGFPKRLPFARHLGLSHDRTFSDLENARRRGFDRSTLSFVERCYEWLPGSIASVLAGGDPTPLEAVAMQADSRPVGLGLDAAADGLTNDDIESVLVQIRALKKARGLET